MIASISYYKITLSWKVKKKFFSNYSIHLSKDFANVEFLKYHDSTEL